ncbi:alpha/beta fold hydrolase [Dongia deserti]|uniref:alpha/beta fold hydrolase n=1 Tax=Dongia deserti TaxID=2268030 RepID=UPI000E65543E|nr:alpha/beta fold hydrolase [Dongia deserti]
MHGSKLAILVASVISWLGGAAEAADTLKTTIENMGGQPCRVSNLTCVSVEVPVDHRANIGPTIKIEYAISFASVESKGILFYAVGGPGGSGIQVADDYLAAFDERLAQNMDIVFFDQRGVGPDHGMACPNAQAVFDLAEVSVDRPDAAIAAARTFATNCVTELKSRALLDFVDTEQAVRDLEIFRQKIGAPKVWVYGESYGTQLVQQYAMLYPTAIKGVVVDGVVDLALDLDGYYAAYTDAAEKILARVLKACAETIACREDMQGDAAAAYDALAAKLPIDVDFPLGNGTIAKRQLTAAMLEADAFYALYGPDDRASFLRALAAASRGQYLPMLRLAYSNLAIDPATEQGAPDPAWFGAAYYAITCSDYGEGPEDGEAAAREVIERAKAFAPQAPRLLRAYFAERLACAFWPKRGPKERPKPYVGGAFPTLILNADADPITPITMSYAVLDKAQDTYMVSMKNGPHVIWGRALACPDEIVFGLMFHGTLPEAKEQVCSQDLIGGYTPLTLRELSAASDAFEVARAVETEIERSPELAGWDGNEPLAIGCDFGGSLEASAAEEGAAYTFSKCAWWPGLIVDGSATRIEDGAEDVGLTLDLAISGSHHGQITYRHNTTTDAMTLTGTYDGRSVATPRPLP